MHRTRAARALPAVPVLVAALTACGPLGTPAADPTRTEPGTTSASPVAPTHSSAPRHAAAPVLVDCVHHGHIRPPSLVTACADGNAGVSRMHWTTWRPARAAGTGVERSNDCTPNCASGHFHAYRVRVAAAAPKPWAGHPGKKHFTLLKVVFTGAHPGPDRTETYHLGG